MDTGSHLLFGFTLAGLAYLDPSVAQHPVLAQSVMMGTLIGSHAPDFDALIRLKGFSPYLRLHRGITHSIPALFMWPAVITIIISLCLTLQGYWFHLYLWTFLAVIFHVFLDMLNVYGVQCLRPFSKEWVHLDILPIFDLFLFVLHVVGIGLWIMMGYDPTVIFAWIYGITFVYITVRAMHCNYLVFKLKENLRMNGIYHLVPGINWFFWRFVVETEKFFYTGIIVYNKVVLKDTYAKQSENPVIQATMRSEDVRVFLDFAQLIHVVCKEIQGGYEVQWSDVRFWYNHRLPFGVDVLLDQNLNVVSHTLGWRKKAWDPPYV